MEKPPHILVIGAGLIGLSTADSLLTRGAQVTLIDKRPGPAQGASFCNSGMIHPSQAQPWLGGSDPEATSKVAKLAVRSRDLLELKLEELELRSARRTRGTVQLFDDIATGKKAQRHSKKLGIGCEDITGNPFTYGRVALYFPNDASGNAYEYCAALARSIRGRGAVSIYNVKPNVLTSLSKSADHVVIAAGAQSENLAKDFNIDCPIRPVTGHALNFVRPHIELPDVPVMHRASHSALTVFSDHVRLSGTVDEASPEVLLDIWTSIAPDLTAALGSPALQWSGERPVCDYGRPIIAHSGQENIWINAGHGHMGWTLSAASGDLMAQMIMGERSQTDFGFLVKS